MHQNKRETAIYIYTWYRYLIRLRKLSLDFYRFCVSGWDIYVQFTYPIACGQPATVPRNVEWTNPSARCSWNDRNYPGQCLMQPSWSNADTLHLLAQQAVHTHLGHLVGCLAGGSVDATFLGTVAGWPQAIGYLYISLYINIYIYIYICVCIHMYIYIYTCNNR